MMLGRFQLTADTDRKSSHATDEASSVRCNMAE